MLRGPDWLVSELQNQLAGPSPLSKHQEIKEYTPGYQRDIVDGEMPWPRKTTSDGRRLGRIERVILEALEIWYKHAHDGGVLADTDDDMRPTDDSPWSAVGLLNGVFRGDFMMAMGWVPLEKISVMRHIPRDKILTPDLLGKGPTPSEYEATRRAAHSLEEKGLVELERRGQWGLNIGTKSLHARLIPNVEIFSEQSQAFMLDFAMAFLRHSHYGDESAFQALAGYEDLPLGKLLTPLTDSVADVSDVQHEASPDSVSSSTDRVGPYVRTVVVERGRGITAWILRFSCNVRGDLVPPIGFEEIELPLRQIDIRDERKPAPD
jgi:hypothetical protein